MAANQVELASVFQNVTQALIENQQTLNQNDVYNHDHGTNMVQTFQTITNALEKKQGMSDSARLAYAARMVGRNTNSGSSQLYAENLNRAAAQFRRKKVDDQSALQLLQTLIGASQTAQTTQSAGSMSGGGDLLGSLLGGMMGGQQQSAPASTPQASSGGDDMLGMLLGGLTGGSSQKPAQGGMNLQSLVTAGMAFMQARQSGADNMQALVQALSAANGMGGADHRQQSTQLVVQAFLQALGAMNSRR